METHGTGPKSPAKSKTRQMFDAIFDFSGGVAGISFSDPDLQRSEML